MFVFNLQTIGKNVYNKNWRLFMFIINTAVIVQIAILFKTYVNLIHTMNTFLGMYINLLKQAWSVFV